MENNNTNDSSKTAYSSKERLGTEKTFFNSVTKKWEKRVLIRKNNSLVWKIVRAY